MEDVTNVIAWGDWATSILTNASNYFRQSHHQLFYINEKTNNIYIKCPSPIVAEYLFIQKDNKDIYDNLISNTRIHIINCGENFATGALTHFSKSTSSHKTNFDLLILYIPPSGTNNSTIGRFFAEILTNSDLFDYICIIDSCSPKIQILSEENLYKTIASIASMLSIFDRSCSVLPILKLLNIKISSFMFATLDELKRGDFKSIYIKNNTVHLPKKYKFYEKDRYSFVFTVSNSISINIKHLLDSNFGNNNYLYIPFLKRFEWKEQNIPIGFSETKKIISNFICVSSNIIPSSVYYYLIDYYKEYWINNGKHMECEKIDYDSLKWLESLGVNAYNKIYPTYTLNDLRIAKNVLYSFNPYIGEK